MLIFRLTPRIQSCQLKIFSHFHKFSPTLYSSSKDESSSGESKVEPKPKKNKEAVSKLNELLKSMTKEEHLVSSNRIDSQLAKPPGKPKKKKPTIVKTVESLQEAAKKVAEELGGDVKQTELDLMSKLLLEESGKGSNKSGNLRDVISGMKVDRGKKAGEVKDGQADQIREEGRAQQVRRILEKQKKDFRAVPSTLRDILRDERHSSKLQGGRVDIFSGEPLGIFKEAPAEEKRADVPELTIWQQLESRELLLAVTHPPSNIYEEMVLWTKQGKLWHFPIDNEQGLEDEKDVYFTEHVFLEHHLDPWCPKKGPLRHFMELVCVGLSKNPYITVQMKLEHINWFRDYFEKKKQILQETGALPLPSTGQTASQDKETL